MLPEARQAWLNAADHFIGNPSSPHRIGGRAEKALSDARLSLAGFLGCDPLDIVWTSGATEANNMALHHFAAATGSPEIWVSSIEHPSVLEPARHYYSEKLRLIPSLPSGVVDLNWIAYALKRVRPRFVALLAANNETGVLQPWREVLSLCRELGVPFLCDATQWIGKLPATGLGECDFVSGSAHKFGGPKGVGFLKCPEKGNVRPFFYGGQQEEGRRAGTENVTGVLSMVTALEVREKALACGEAEVRLRVREQFEKELLTALPGSRIVGQGENRLWNTVSALMPEADCRKRWVVKLDKHGFSVSTGSACASGREEPSHVIASMDYSPEEAGRVLRFSSGWETSESDWLALLQALTKVSCEMGSDFELNRT